MASAVSFIILVAATLLAVSSAFPSDKLRFNRPPPLKALSPPNPQAGPKGLLPRPERSAGEDLKASESYGFGYGYGYGYPFYGFGGYGYGYPYYGYGYGYGYPYYGYGYGFGYPYYGGFYGYPGFYDWWLF
ncbi:hypothetical protein O3M35_003241 [Rhynocoris fuscipes]|uniref:Uncharacterized protein n=1 Tax=Rhynocoris fuscipes TaxID=488301 RepID=A0AAW1CQZ1_9HEMI